jgi:glycosyltransferase involved in cell wall biosynthesis
LLLGHSVDLVTYPFGDAVPLAGLNIIRSPKPPFISDVKIGPSLAKLILDVPLYLTARRLLANKHYDLIHSHEEAAFFSVGLARKHGIKHIYDMHSSLPQQLKNFEKFDLPFIGKVFERLERYVLDSCDGVITICGDLANTVETLGVAVPHSMIENTADDAHVFEPTDVDVAGKYSLQDKTVILYTGTFEAYQGLDLLMNAFAIVARQRPRARLLMVGGRPEQIDAMGHLAKELGVGKSVVFTGTVPSSEIPSFLRSADVIASPRSSGTNTPLKIYGYMRSGVPLVATNKYTHTQTLDDSTAHLVSATSEGLADGIMRLIDDSSYADQLAQNARQLAAREYSDEAYLERVSRFYADVFGSPEVSGKAAPSGTRRIQPSS